MLNERSVRDQITQVREALGKLDAERTALQSIEKSLLSWLDLHGGAREELPFDSISSNGASSKPKKIAFTKLGTITLAEAMIRALQNREGVVMDSQDIINTALSMGAKTNSQKPIPLAEWILYDIIKKNKAPIQRVKPHKYVYVKRAESGPRGIQNGTYMFDEKLAHNA